MREWEYASQALWGLAAESDFDRGFINAAAYIRAKEATYASLVSSRESAGLMEGVSSASHALTHQLQPQLSLRWVLTSRESALRPSTSATIALSFAGSFGRMAYGLLSSFRYSAARADANARTASAVRGRSLEGSSRAPGGGEGAAAATGDMRAGWHWLGGERRRGGAESRLEGGRTLGGEAALGERRLATGEAFWSWAAT